MATKRQSIFEDLIDVISYLPWWVGALLAPVSYFLLHAYALRAMPETGSVQDLNSVVIPGLLRALAVFGQYIIPFVCILGSATSAYNQFVRRKLHGKVSQSPIKNVLNGMSWREFEMLVGEAYRKQGYQVKELGGSGPDGGADLVLTKDGQKYLVQCKQWKAYKVGVQPVRELLGVMVGMGASGGIVVTSGEFTQDAVNFARNNNIQLVDGLTLHEMTKGVTSKGVKRSNASSAPVCQKCGSVMVLRTAKKGYKSGQKFWGCTKYPTCRFTIPLEN
ncbi:MAG: restriction endonuclease [Desulfobulbaceae bacterium]